jgi:hypothetical protein
VQGTRLYETEGEEDFLYRIALSPCSYGEIKGHWYATTPNGLFGNLGSHTVVEHEDGTITVSPSILVQKRLDGLSWHGYLERGVWREC